MTKREKIILTILVIIAITLYVHLLHMHDVEADKAAMSMTQEMWDSIR